MKRLLAIATILYFATTVSAQEALKSTEEEYYDFLSLTGQAERPTLGYRTLSDSEWTVSDENHVWSENNLGTKYFLYENENPIDNFFMRGVDQSVKVKIYGPEWFNSYNTAAPYGQNDGALWQGKGYNTSFTAGARLEAYGLELTFKSQLSYSQNKEFDLMPSVTSSTYGYYQSGIDLPQRFGDDSIKTFDFGDTEVRYTWHTLTFGAGFQSPWLGSAWLNPMLGSNNAPTYPKIDAGLRKTSVYMPYFGWYIGDIEGRVWVGRLEESDYFDNNPDNDYRILTGMSASFAPSFIPNLTVGVNRIFIANWAAHNLKYVGRLFTLSKSNGSQVGTHEDEDQKVALFADWQFSNIGFEVYGEFGIDDFSGDELANSFHTAIYTIGIKQSIPIAETIQKYTGDLKSEFIFEWNNFERSQDYLITTYIGYYGHGSISQGYTQNGQIIGAGSGSFGNSQFLGYKVYHSHGSVMLFFHRYCPDNNYLYNKMAVSNLDYYKNYHNSFLTYRTYGISATRYITNNLILNLSFIRACVVHKLYERENSTFTNNSFSFSAKYNF